MSLNDYKKQFIDGYVKLATQQAEAMWPIYEQMFNKFPEGTPKEDIDKAFMCIVESTLASVKVAGDQFTDKLKEQVNE